MSWGGTRSIRSSSMMGDVRRHRPDYSIFLVIGILLIIGLIVIYAISPGLSRLRGGVGDDYYLSRQFISIGLGLLVFSATSVIPINFWRNNAKFLLIVAGVSSLLLLIPGAGFNDPINGATRWLQIGPLSFQPAELIKFALLIYCAGFLTERVKNNTLDSINLTIKPYLLILGIAGFVVVFLQKDYGSMMVIVSILLCMIYVAGLRIRYLMGLIGAAGLASILAIAVAPHRVARFLTFLNPEADSLGSGYHISQALIAIGSGGILGQGLGKSIQAFGYLPEAANDSIFAVFAEKFGFVGSVLLLAIFGVLLFKIISIIERTPDMYSKLLASGIFGWLAAHVMVNVGAMLSLLPLKGITLPFISYGGSSLLFIMAIMGLLLQISRYTVPKVRLSSNNSGGSSNREDIRMRRRQRRTRITGVSRSI